MLNLFQHPTRLLAISPVENWTLKRVQGDGYLFNLIESNPGWQKKKTLTQPSPAKAGEG